MDNGKWKMENEKISLQWANRKFKNQKRKARNEKCKSKKGCGI